jgi:hypothetical protein
MELTVSSSTRLPTPTQPPGDAILAEHATEIRRLGKRVVADVIETGRRLAECRNILKEDSRWRGWLESELRLSPQTAGRSIQIYEQRSKLEHLDLPISALYLLTAPSTPQEARDEIVERAEAGESVSVAEVKQTIETTKGRQQRNYTFARTFRAMKLGGEVVESLKGTSLHNAREQDELVILNRGAPQGGLTDIVKQLRDDAVAGKQVSAIEYRKNGRQRLERHNIALRSMVEEAKPGLAEKLDPWLEALFEQSQRNMVTVSLTSIVVAVTKLERLLVEYGIMPPSRRSEDPQGYAKLLKQRAARRRNVAETTSNNDAPPPAADDGLDIPPSPRRTAP